MRINNPIVTRTRILDSAELLFAERAYHGVSLRDITEAAQVNLAAVNYHFQNKENLFREVFLRRIRPLNARRLSLLSETSSTGSVTPLPLRIVLELFAAPLFELYRSPSPGARAFVYLLCRSLNDPSALTDQILAAEYTPVLNRFGQAIRRHASHLSPEDFLWRLSFVVGALSHTLATLHQMSSLTRGICRSDDYDGALTRFIAHAEETFRAPANRHNNTTG